MNINEKTTKRSKTVVLTVALLCLVAPLQAAAEEALNEPKNFNPKLGDPAKKTVLIYYANETAPDEAEAQNYQRLIEWLESSANPKVQQIAKSLQGDLDKFHGVVDIEIAAIRSNVATHKSDPQIAVALFTNRTARHGYFEVMTSGQDSTEALPFTVPHLDGLVYKANPLSHPIVFQSALAGVSQQFDPREHQFVLVTKSHGSAGFAMTPRVVLDISKLKREALLARLDRDVAAMAAPPSQSEAALEFIKGGQFPNTVLDSWKSDTILDSWKSDTILDAFKTDTIVDKTDTLTKNDTLDAEQLTGEPPKIGVSKASYVATLLQITNATGMQFPLLFIESCRSQLDDVEIRELKAGTTSIGRLYTSDLTGLQYTTIDYDRVFKSVSAGEPLTSAMHKELFAKYEEEKAAREKTKTNGAGEITRSSESK